MRKTRQVSSILCKLRVAFGHLANGQHRPMGRQNLDTLVLWVICSFQLLLSNHSRKKKKKKDSLQSFVFISHTKKLLIALKHENLHEIFIFSLAPHLKSQSHRECECSGPISVPRASILSIVGGWVCSSPKISHLN